MHNKSTARAEMSRKCSHCGHNGHNSRTCIHAMPMAAHAYDGEGTSITTTNNSNSRTGIRLFGFDVVAADAPAPEPFAMRKSWSMGNLAHYGNPEENPPRFPIVPPLPAEPFDGYASDDLIHATSNARECRKGVPWSEEEHCLFLEGLERLGKGDWRGISRNFVKTRTPTQVASHAQKYFLRRSNLHKRRRRSSLFDITADIAASTSLQAHESHKGVGGIEALPSIDEMSTSNFIDPEKMETEEVLGDEAFQMGGGRGRGIFSICCDEEGGGPLAERSSVQYQQAGLGLPPHVVGGGIRYDTVALVPMCPPPQPLEPVPVLVPVSVPGFSNSKIVKPTALFPSGGVPLPPLPPPKAMDNEVVKLSELSLNSAHPGIPPSALSHKLHEEEERGKRHSAFQAINSAMPDANTDLDTPENKCHASISVS